MGRVKGGSEFSARKTEIVVVVIVIFKKRHEGNYKQHALRRTSIILLWIVELQESMRIQIYLPLIELYDEA